MAAAEDHEADGVVERDGRSLLWLPQRGVAWALPPAKELQAAQYFPHLFPTSHRNFLHLPHLPGIAEHQEEVGSDTDGAAGRGQAQAHGWGQQRGSERGGAQGQPQDGCECPGGRQGAPADVGDQGAAAELAKFPSCPVEVRDLAAQPPPLLQQGRVEVLRGVCCRHEGSTVPLHGFCPEKEKSGVGSVSKNPRETCSSWTTISGMASNQIFVASAQLQERFSICTHVHTHIHTQTHMNVCI